MNRESRKMEHIQEALQQPEVNESAFDDLTLLPNPISDVDMAQISLTTYLGELTLSSPLLINAMTGGARDTKEINRSLRRLASKLSIPMAIGSQMSALKKPELADTYKVVREENPKGIIFANLGQEATVEQAKEAVEMVQADALQIHLNVMQELIMPEGNRSFSGMLGRIAKIIEKIEVPIIIKEVGFGMTAEAVRKLKEIGANIIDVGGKGGTNFAKIENARGGNPYPFLNNWGIPTPIALLEALQIKGIQLVGSGGIRHGLDAIKALSLGASLVGIAGPILKALLASGLEGAMRFIEDLHQQMRLIMTAVGARTIDQLRSVPVIIQGKSLEWCKERGIPTEIYARRKLERSL